MSDILVCAREAAVKCLDLLDTLPPEASAAQHRRATFLISMDEWMIARLLGWLNFFSWGKWGKCCSLKKTPQVE